MPIEELASWITPEREKVRVFRLISDGGMICDISEFGATVIGLRVPDGSGSDNDVVLGFDDPSRYYLPHPYFGGIVGRFANRIRRGHFSLDGGHYTLACNDGPNHLHGGGRGFDRKIWRADTFADKSLPAVSLRLTSPHGEEGYPGTVTVTVVYALFGNRGLMVGYKAETDRPTIINLTQHSYFNLAGMQASTVLDHVVNVYADHYLPVDETRVPTGEFRHVQGTPFDFRTPHSIGDRIADPDEQLRIAGGYDHCWVLDTAGSGPFRKAARVLEPHSGRMMTLLTTEPGIQIYSGNFLDGTIVGKQGRTYPRRSGLCLETQHFPDSPNQPTFPSTVLRPASPFMSSTLFIFSPEH